nr:hypothetical protein [Tanacetum cinerariifolium]GEW56321.1 hypothetical protein [Tanacetum cinerariifolium]
MSLLPRRRVIVNGNQRMRTHHYYWCRRCQRTFRTNSNNLPENVCPRCLGILPDELDMLRPRFVSNIANIEPNLGEQFIENLALLFDPPEPQPQYTGPPGLIHTATEQNLDPNFIFHVTGSQPSLLDVGSRDDQNAAFEEANNVFNEEESSRPPPESSSGIASLPLVSITSSHLVNDTHCPVCKDEFELGEEVKELPYNVNMNRGLEHIIMSWPFRAFPSSTLRHPNFLDNDNPSSLLDIIGDTLGSVYDFLFNLVSPFRNNMY